MSDFSAGDKTTKGNTRAAGSATTTHQFTGSVYIEGLFSASLGISASTFVGDGAGLTNLPGGGGGGGISWDGSTTNGVATYKDGDEATVESNLTFNGANNRLTVTGTVIQSGSTVTFNVPEDTVDAFVISGSTGGYNPTAGFMNVDTTNKWVQFGSGINIPTDKAVNFGPGTQGGGDATIKYNGYNLVISGALGGSETHISGNTIFAQNVDMKSDVFMTGTLNHTGSYKLSGALTITGVEAAPMLVLDDTDASAQIGRAHVGYVGSSDFAAFAHQDNADTSNYCISQRYTGQTDINTRAGTNMTFRYASATRMQLDQNGGFSIGSNYAPAEYKLDVSGSTRIGTDPYNGSHKLFVTGGIIQTGSTALFHVANGQVDAFVISGSAGGFNPSQGLMNVDTNAQWVRFGGGINIPTNWGVNFGVGDGQGNGTGGKIQYNGGNLEISGAHNSTSIISGSVNFGYDTPTFTIDADNGAISAKCDAGGSSGFTVAGPTALTGSEQYTVLKVEAAGKTVANGNPALVVDSNGVGVGVGSPKVALDVAWDPTYLSNNEGGGERVFFGTCSGPTVAGALYYLNSQGGWESASAHGTGSGNNTLLGIAIGTGPDTHGMLTRGWFNVGTYYKEGFVTGSAVYIQSGTVGNTGYMSGAAPTAADSYVRIVGYASTQSDVIYFNPGTNWVELS